MTIYDYIIIMSLKITNDGELCFCLFVYYEFKHFEDCMFCFEILLKFEYIEDVRFFLIYVVEKSGNVETHVFILLLHALEIK